MAVKIEKLAELPDALPQPAATSELAVAPEPVTDPEGHAAQLSGEADITDPEVISDREVLLQMLLDEAEYQEVQESGLDQLFYQDDEKGHDSLRHILCGELAGNKRMPKGFHHMPSAEKMSLEDGYGNLLTRVEKVVDADGNEVERVPGEPYRAQVVVDGKEKTKLRRVQGRPEVMLSASSMFPDEMSALDIMKTINTAVQNADPAYDTIMNFPDGSAYYNLIGKVPIKNGTYEMGVCVAMNMDTMTVVTAFPSLKHSGTIAPAEAPASPAQPDVASAAGGIALGREGARHD